MADGVALRFNQTSYTAQQERLAAAIGMVPDSTASGLSMREGRRLAAGLELSISGDGLSAVVQPGVATVSHAVTSGGDYTAVFPAVVNKTLAAKPGAGQKRRDTVVVDVSDADVTQKPTAIREANIQLLQGTATAGTPTAPAAGTMQLEVGQVAFDGANTPVVHPTNPRYTWASGGIGVVFSATERNALPAYDGMKVYRDDLDGFQERVGGAWRDEAVTPADTGWLIADAATFLLPHGGWSNHGCRIRKIGTRVRLEIDVERTGAFIEAGDFANVSIITVAAAYRPSVDPSASNQWLIGTGNASPGGQVSLAVQPSTGILQAWASNQSINVADRVRGTFEYYTD